MTVFTVGHSTKPIHEFLRLLHAHGIVQLADVRTIPRSRRYPHFSQELLAPCLAEASIAYCHFPELGGLRKPRRDSPNTAWRVEGFRGYADYMETPEFTVALDHLVQWAKPGRTAVMCAESMWWRCHRKLIADALLATGVEVRHILSEKSAPPHSLTAFARLTERGVRYS